SDVLMLPKTNPVIAKFLEAGTPMQIHDEDDAPKNARKLLRRFGHSSVLLQPLRLADKLVGVLFVTWKEHHVVSGDEHELIGVLAGFGAAAIRSIGLYRELDDAYLSTVSALTATIQARDHYREDHQRRVAADALALGERMHLRPDELRDLRYASSTWSSATTRCSPTARTASRCARTWRLESYVVSPARGTTRRWSTSSWR